MRISDKMKKLLCLIVAISLIVPIAIGIINMFIVH